MYIYIISFHLIFMSQIIYMKDTLYVEYFENSFYFLPLNTYPEYNRPIQRNIPYTYTYIRFPHWKFSLIFLLYSISAPRAAYITIQAHLSHVAFSRRPRFTSPPFATPFEPSRSFYFVCLYRFPPPPPPPFEAMGASSGVQAIIPSGWNSIGTTEMAQGSWPMA